MRGGKENEGEEGDIMEQGEREEVGWRSDVCTWRVVWFIPYFSLTRRDALSKTV